MAPRRLAVGASALALFALAACAQQNLGTAPAGSAASVQQAQGEKPPKFANGTVRVALVRQSGAGDYFEQWGNGAKRQAEMIGMKLDVYDAQASNAKQATYMETAINSGVDGIIVDHGLGETMNPLIDKAIKKGIPVVVYDVAVTNPRAVNTLQDDHAIARMVLEEMEKALQPGAKVGYINILGFAPLDRRHEVWLKKRKQNNWQQMFMVGKFTSSVTTDNCRLATTALKAHPDVTAIFAPYDALAKAAVCAIENNGLKDQVEVYGVDISTADIQVMTEKGSPWVATAATDPRAVGAAVVRAMALKIAGQLEQDTIRFPATLFTQEFLRQKNIDNMRELRKAKPALDLAYLLTADWIPQIAY